MTASTWDKFLLLSWKNWIIQRRHPVQTLFEVLVPVLVCALLILIRGLVVVNEYTDDFRYNATVTSNIGGEIFFEFENKVLAYSPENPVLGGIVENVANGLGFTSVMPRANAIDLQSYAMTWDPFASIEFEDSLMVSSKIKFF